LTKIIVSDDQLINIRVLTEQVKKLDILDKCEFCCDGKETVELVIELLATETSKPLQTQSEIPICLILID